MITSGEADAAGPIYVVRNEVDPDSEYHCDALADRFPDAVEVDFARGERFDPTDAAGVVLSGSTAGVYQSDRYPWIDEQEALVRDLVSRSVPTLGVCFGHQVVHSALGGSVVADELTTDLVDADLDADPLFDGVTPTVPALHGDLVTEPGDDVAVIGSAPHAPVFAGRHERAPLWTVQFHPEVTAALDGRLRDRFDWDPAPRSFDDVTAERVLDNFRALVSRAGNTAIR